MTDHTTTGLSRALHDWRARAIAPPLQVMLVFLVAVLFYFGLYGELPYHDVSRFVHQIESGRFVWDIAHVFMQPATLLWHQYLGFGESAEMSQKHINTVATAAGIAIFYLTMLRLEVPLVRRIAAVVVVAASCSLMTLAPTGHMKMLAFPFLTAALYQAALWERRLASDRALWMAAVLLALAAAFLASCLAAAPFLGLAVLVLSRHRGESWSVGLKRAVIFGVICGGAFFLFVSLSYLAFAHGTLSAHGFAAAVAGKDNLRPAFTSIADSIGRIIFGTPNNFIAAPALGSVLRAWMAGLIPSLKPYAGTLLLQVGPWLATGLLIAATYVAAVRQAIAGKAVLMPLAFLIGAQAWMIYYNVNDPEVIYALSVPTVLLFLLAFPERITRIALPVWAAATLIVNLVVIGIPTATFPLHAAEAEIRKAYTPNDLLVSFSAYPGKAYLGFFDLPDRRHLELDTAYREAKKPNVFFAEVDRNFTETWRRSGKVVVFDVLDPMNWNAPWFVLRSKGMTKTMMTQFFFSHYTIVPLGEVAHLKAWEIRPRAAPGDGRQQS